MCRGMHRGAQRCAEVVGKNQDFMLIRFLNADILMDVVRTHNQSESCMEVHGGVRRDAQRCTEVCGGGGEKIRILC